jgi:hypothetical protein
MPGHDRFLEKSAKGLKGVTEAAGSIYDAAGETQT